MESSTAKTARKEIKELIDEMNDDDVIALLFDKNAQKITNQATHLNLSDDTKIHELGLSTRALNFTKGSKIETIGQLRAKTARQLLKLRNCGPYVLKEIKQKLKLAGHSLAGE